MRRFKTLWTFMAVLSVVALLGLFHRTAAQAEPQPRAASDVKVMQWNACGNNKACKYYNDPDGLIATIRWHMLNNGPAADAAFVQEVCSSFAKKLEFQLEDYYGTEWDVRFAPIKMKTTDNPATAPNKKCVGDKGDYGILMALPDENTWWEARYLPSPEGKEWRVALCATVPSWSAKLCDAHFTSPGEDPDASVRTKQVKAFTEFVWPSRFTVVFGGDLNLKPPAVADYPGGGLNPVYDSFVECAQSDVSAPRDGPGTYYRTDEHDNSQTDKLDYLFTNAGLLHGCGTTPNVVLSSDHRPIWMTMKLPVT